MKILMCKPEYFSISYEINPWMNVNRGADNPLATAQWQNLYQTIIGCGAQIELVPPVEGLPDLVFTANSAMRVGQQVYLSRFKHPERQLEYREFKQWFERAGYQIVSEPREYFDAQGNYTGPSFEGAGDALFLGNTLFAAYGFRTDKSIYPKLSELFSLQKLVLCELVDPYFYHLDTCFCPLNDHQAIWSPEAFSPESRRRMEQHTELFAVPEQDSRHFACNAVIIGQNAIIPAECPGTKSILEKLGFTVHSCPMTEFIKSGGACKCLTFVLNSR